MMMLPHFFLLLCSPHKINIRVHIHFRFFFLLQKKSSPLHYRSYHSFDSFSEDEDIGDANPISSSSSSSFSEVVGIVVYNCSCGRFPSNKNTSIGIMEQNSKIKMADRMEFIHILLDDIT
mmetsp:Transcript_11548/g.16954  ORF Transcript_11548/g.16954 Transcript_11548/m.16954 type:complete len:120 (-) Transcript_11548:1606-1965(-)